jgi:hypothetical protein
MGRPWDKVSISLELRGSEKCSRTCWLWSWWSLDVREVEVMRAGKLCSPAVVSGRQADINLGEELMGKNNRPATLLDYNYVTCLLTLSHTTLPTLPTSEEVIKAISFTCSVVLCNLRRALDKRRGVPALCDAPKASRRSPCL